MAHTHPPACRPDADPFLFQVIGNQGKASPICASVGRGIVVTFAAFRNRVQEPIPRPAATSLSLWCGSRCAPWHGDAWRFSSASHQASGCMYDPWAIRSLVREIVISNTKRDMPPPGPPACAPVGISHRAQAVVPSEVCPQQRLPHLPALLPLALGPGPPRRVSSSDYLTHG